MPHLSPQSLTRDEQQALLRAAAGHPRDSLLFSLALGTGLRPGELVGQNVGDLYFPSGQPCLRVNVRPEIAKRGRAGDLFLPDALTPKLKRFWAYKREHRERLDPLAPLFCGLFRRRISPRRLQVLFRDWQLRAGFDRLYPFHALRHTAVTNVYRASRDLFLAQRFARHASPLTTTIYTHVSDEELFSRVSNLESFTDEGWEAFQSLRESTLRTARAWALKGTAMAIYDCKTAGQAHCSRGACARPTIGTIQVRIARLR